MKVKLIGIIVFVLIYIGAFFMWEVLGYKPFEFRLGYLSGAFAGIAVYALVLHIVGIK